MFFIKTAEIKVDFFTSNAAVFEHARPVRATRFIPEWWRSLPTTDYAPLSLAPTMSMRTCAGFIDLYTSGLIQPLWSDLNIMVTPEGRYEYKFADCESSIDQHAAFQFQNSPFSNGFVHLKLNSPWVFNTNKDIKWAVVPPLWNGIGVDDAYVAHGVLRSGSINIPININVFIRQRKETVVHRMPFGLPLAHMIPLSEARIAPRYHLVSDEELNRRKCQTAVSRFFVNKFRKAAKLCPHAK
jgi:hypothetical protein